MKKKITMLRLSILFLGIMLIAIPGVLAAQPLLSPTSTGLNSESRSANYDMLVNDLFANGKTTTTIDGNKLWVPWFGRSDSCELANLKSGSSCNSGTTIDFTHNCMVTDEFSQVGILVAMGNSQSRMDQFANTVKATASTNGEIPAWRVFRNGNTIEPCRSGINGNCDTASDATARIISALYTAAKNPSFSSSAQTAYLTQAKALSSAMLQYEVDKTCRPSSVGDGNICYWLAAGSEAKRGGIASTDYAYTGYYADAIIAMLQAFAATGEQRFRDAAEDFGLNYLEAAKFNGKDFTAPPGRSYKWIAGANGVLSPQCTASCNPTQWEDADAPRALGMCQANYYAKEMGIDLPGMQAYCDAWETRYGKNPSSIPTQYKPDGTAANAPQSGYFAQGLQALFESGTSHNNDFASILDNALKHYSPSTKTWDNTACFGIYHTAFSIRALGMGIGRDLASFTTLTPFIPTPTPACVATTEVCDGKDNNCDGIIDEGNVCASAKNSNPPTNNPTSTQTNTVETTTKTTACFQDITQIPATCAGGDVTTDTFNGCRTIICTSGDSNFKVLACDKPDEGAKQYFEMYKQEQNGDAITELCLGDVCVSSEGYVKSTAYPLCLTTTDASSTTKSPTKNQENNIEELDTMINEVIETPVLVEENTAQDNTMGGQSSDGQESLPPTEEVNNTPPTNVATSSNTENLNNNNNTTAAAIMPTNPVLKTQPKNTPSPWVYILELIIVIICSFIYLFLRTHHESVDDIENKLLELRKYITANISRGYSASLLEILLLRNGWSAKYINDAFNDLGIIRDLPEFSTQGNRRNPSPNMMRERQPEPTHQ